MAKGGTGGKITLGCGCLMLFVASAVMIFGAFHVFFDPRGAISANEAMPALIVGGFFGFVAFVIVVVGAFFAFRKQS